MKRESQNVFKDERDEMEHIGEKREGDVSIGGDTMQMLNREICCDW